MTTVFSRIISGEFPATFIWRDERCVAFMSINPVAAGHALVVPIDEIDLWDQCPPDLVTHLFSVSHSIARAQRVAFDCRRVGVILAGYEVPHTHIHLIPTNSMREMSFENAAASVDQIILNESAERIRDALAAQA